MKYVSVANRWWFVVAVVFVVVGFVFLTQPLDYPDFTGAPRSGWFIGGIGLSIVVLTVVEALLARSRSNQIPVAKAWTIRPARNGQAPRVQLHRGAAPVAGEAAEVTFGDEVFGRIDEIVAPGSFSTRKAVAAVRTSRSGRRLSIAPAVAQEAPDHHGQGLPGARFRIVSIRSGAGRAPSVPAASHPQGNERCNDQGCADDGEPRLGGPEEALPAVQSLDLAHDAEH